MPPSTRRQNPLVHLARIAADGVEREVSQGRALLTAEMAIAGQVAWELTPDLTPEARAWIERQLQHSQAQAFVLAPPKTKELASAAREVFRHADEGSGDPLAGFYETLLAALDLDRRMHRGVFYTPVEIVRFLVRSVDDVLRDQWRLPSGLADAATWDTAASNLPKVQPPPGLSAASPLVRILDPALGAGLFLTEIIHHARQSFADQAAWNAFVPEGLLPRLGGIEIVPAAAGIAIVRIAQALAETGYQFHSPALLDIRVGDALVEPVRPPWTVIVGNPPFSGIGASKHDWMLKLMRGMGPQGEPRANYFDVAGQPLGERKHWLLDDYVQFLRMAHEQVETCGCGIVALVTPHGYLNNLSFRGLREKLAGTFPTSQIVDLHGNAKRRERAPDGGRDENVFGIEQGIALATLSRPPQVDLVKRQYWLVDLWGTRQEKLSCLAQRPYHELQPYPLSDTSPALAWVTTSTESFPEYDRGWSLADAMPLNTTAPVTARDAFVVALEAQDFEQRLRDMLDAALPDEEIRRRYFHRTRSRQHLPGDTRSWKLSAARRRLQQLATAGHSWKDLLAKVQYRPYDERAILWADWLIDWPRSEVMQHVAAPDNLTLITRRQAPNGQPWNFAWITASLALDGVIRSDNCGSESLFPLWLVAGDAGTARTANFAPAFLAACEQRLERAAAPEELFAYVYAVLHSPTYRTRYVARLCCDFPRILLPRDAAVFAQLAALGQALIDVHLLRPAKRWEATIPVVQPRADALVATGFPKWRDERLWFNACDCLPCPQSVWEFRVGTHQVLRKYLRARQQRVLSAIDVERVQRVVQAIAESLTIVARIDAVAGPLWNATASHAPPDRPRRR